MRMDRYLPPEHPLARFHRIAAAVFGACLMVFGALGLANRVPLFTTDGIDVLGLSSNGLLAVVSIAVGAILVGAAAWGRSLSSTTTAAIGGLFVLSGLANLAVLNTEWNVFAFELRNVVFSLIAGLVLMFFGLYGRVSGGLPEDNPYVRYRHHQPPAHEDRSDVIADEKRIAEIEPMCEDEMAVAEGHPTPDQQRRVTAERLRNVQQERRRAYEHYRESGRTEQQQVSAQNLWADFQQDQRTRG